MPQASEAARRSSRCRTYAARLPAQLSGGQQQRVALARALDHRSANPAAGRAVVRARSVPALRMRAELKRLQRELGISFIHVTHGQDEAMALADIVVVMNDGRIEQLGTPRDVFNKPRTEFVGTLHRRPQRALPIDGRLCRPRRSPARCKGRRSRRWSFDRRHVSAMSNTRAPMSWSRSRPKRALNLAISARASLTRTDYSFVEHPFVCHQELRRSLAPGRPTRSSATVARLNRRPDMKAGRRR